MKDGSIGIVDSGLGGLAIARELWARLPYEDTIYLADHAFFPYGDKSKEVINERLVILVNYLLGQGVKALVVACNTATTNSIDYLRKIYSLPIIGVEPAVKPALEKHRSENVVVLTTPNTAKSGFFGSGEVKVHPCPGLAEGIELYAQKSDLLEQLVRKTLDSIDNSYTALVLGCTHYLLVKDLFLKLVPGGVIVIDPSKAVAEQTATALSDRQLIKTSGQSSRLFLTTGKAREVSAKASALIGQGIIFSPCSL